jgi:hypothetical protein
MFAANYFRIFTGVNPQARSEALRIDAGGNVGIGTMTPVNKLDVAGTISSGSGGSGTLLLGDPADSGGNVHFKIAIGGGNVDLQSFGNAPLRFQNGGGGNVSFGTAANFLGTVSLNGGSGGDGMALDASTGQPKSIQSYANQPLVLNPVGNNVGIGTTAPDALLSVNGTADKPGGGSWNTFSDERLKNVKGGFVAGIDELMQISPIRYRYKKDNALGIRDQKEHVGVNAQQIERVLPDAVSKNAQGYRLVDNDPILWTMLNAIKQQERRIRALEAELRATRQRAR